VRTLFTAALYFGTFVAIGLVARWWLRRKVGSPDVQSRGGPAPKRRFLLGVWRNED
jgi:hypothetical protein